VLLPTPPFPLATAIVFLTPGNIAFLLLSWWVVTLASILISILFKSVNSFLSASANLLCNCLQSAEVGSVIEMSTERLLLFISNFFIELSIKKSLLKLESSTFLVRLISRFSSNQTFIILVYIKIIS